MKDYVDTYQKKKSEYEERIDRGAEDDQTEQDYLNEMKALKEQLEEYEKYSVAAQKELDKRAKAEEKASKAAEKKAAADEKAAKRAQEEAEREFQRSVRDEQQAQDQENRENESAHKRLQALQFDETMAQWQKQVKEMPMDELIRTQTDLKQLYAELREKLKQELEDGDLGASDQTESEIKEVAARLGAVDSVLSATGSGLGTISPLSDLNATGYSTVGNSSIGSAVQNLQLQENRKTNEILKSVDDVLTNMSTYVMEIRNKVESPSGNSATW